MSEASPFAAMLGVALRCIDSALLATAAGPLLFFLANTPGAAQEACCRLVPLVFHRVDHPNRLLLRGILDRFLKRVST